MKSSGTRSERSSPDTQQNQPDHSSFSSEFFREADDLEESWDGEKKHLTLTKFFFALSFQGFGRFFSGPLVQHSFLSSSYSYSVSTTGLKGAGNSGENSGKSTFYFIRNSPEIRLHAA